MSCGYRQKWSHASPDGSTQPDPAVCSHAHQSLFQLPPSTWCAAVAVPHRKPSGKEIAMGAHPKRPYTRCAMTAALPTVIAGAGACDGDQRSHVSVLEDILAAKRAELALLQESEARDTLRRAALDAPPARDFSGALRRS